MEKETLRGRGRGGAIPGQSPSVLKFSKALEVAIFHLATTGKGPSQLFPTSRETIL